MNHGHRNGDRSDGRNDRTVQDAMSCPTTAAIRSCWCAARVVCLGQRRESLSRFLSRLGLQLLGHCPEPVVEAVQEQVATLIHVPNTWYTEAQGLWAQALSERSFGGQAFFLQFRRRGQRSGDQAGPAAHAQGALQDHHVRGGFHGRTLGRHRRHRPAEVSRRARAA